MGQRAQRNREAAAIAAAKALSCGHTPMQCALWCEEPRTRYRRRCRETGEFLHSQTVWPSWEAPVRLGTFCQRQVQPGRVRYIIRRKT